MYVIQRKEVDQTTYMGKKKSRDIGRVHHNYGNFFVPMIRPLNYISYCYGRQADVCLSGFSCFLTN